MLIDSAKLTQLCCCIQCVCWCRRPRSADDWWQLFDSGSSQFYYYNVTLQQSSWLAPCHETEILPLAILQVSEWMDGWMDGWMDQLIDRCMEDGSTDRWMDQ